MNNLTHFNPKQPLQMEIQKENQINQYENIQNQQNLHQIEKDQQSYLDNTSQPSIYLKLFFTYLYFTQGLVAAYSLTMPYVYKQLPTYSVMALFNAAILPYSFKFIIAPFLQKYTFFKYGKRKFWIIISQILSSLAVFISSFYTDLNDANIMAIYLLAANFFFTLQDISLDSLARKELRIPHIVSAISSTSQLTGSIIGSMLLLKLTSIQFANQINLKQPISTPSTIIMIQAIIVFIPSIFVHFYFKQTFIKTEYESKNKNICQIISSYRMFFKTKGKYFRTCVLLLIFTQGFNFYNAGYEYQLVREGFSRNTINTIQNIITIPISILTCMLTQNIQPFGIKKGIFITLMGQLIIYSLLRIFFPLDVYIIAFSSFLLAFLESWRFQITSIFIFQFPIHCYSGMYITFLASFANLGSALTLHTKILDWISWWIMSWIGLFIQFILLIVFQLYLIDWKDRGIVDLNQLQNKENVLQIQQESPIQLQKIQINWKNNINNKSKYSFKKQQLIS